MFTGVCILCEAPCPDQHISCLRCQRSLYRLRNDEPQRAGYGLYQYKDEARALLHQAKIKNQRQALKLIIALCMHHPTLIECLSWADHIMPAPSSLWGRLRGRIDVAACTAHALAKAYNKPMLQPPYHLGWHLQKRAMHKDKPTQSSSKRRRRFIPGNLLIFDDIATTGSTLMELSHQLECDSIQALCVASNRQSKKVTT